MTTFPNILYEVSMNQKSKSKGAFSFRNLFNFAARRDDKDLDYERITEISMEVNNQFAKDFSMWMKYYMYEQVKQEGKTSDDQQQSKFSLLPAPTPSRRIKRGYLKKMGNNVKNWKNRYFVVYNQADNYALVYYEDETMAREKGRINCCGYSVEKFTPEEEKHYGGLGFRLLPSDASKRTWYLRADSPQMLNDWMHVCDYVCSKCVFQSNESEIFQRSFLSAYKATRREYGYFGVCEVYGSHEDTLLVLTQAILHREILEEHFQRKASQAKRNTGSNKSKSSGASSSPNKGMSSARTVSRDMGALLAPPPSLPLAVVQQVRSSVDMRIQPIIQSTLRQLATETENLQRTYPASLRKQRRQLIALEADLCAKIGAGVDRLVEGVGREWREGGELLLTRVALPLSLAYLSAVQAFSVEAMLKFLPLLGDADDTEETTTVAAAAAVTTESSRVQSGSARSSCKRRSRRNSTLPLHVELKQVLEDLEAQIDNVGDRDSSLLENPLKILFRLQSETLLEIEAFLQERGLTPYVIYEGGVEDIQRLLRCALHTLQKGLAGGLEGVVAGPEDGGAGDGGASLASAQDEHTKQQSGHRDREQEEKDAGQQEERDSSEEEKELRRKEKLAEVKAKIRGESAAADSAGDYVSFTPGDRAPSPQHAAGRRRSKEKDVKTTSFQPMQIAPRNVSVSTIPPPPSVNPSPPSAPPLLFLNSPALFSSLMKHVVEASERDALLLAEERCVQVLGGVWEGGLQELLLPPAVDLAYSLGGGGDGELPLPLLAEREVRRRVLAMAQTLAAGWMLKVRTQVGEVGGVWGKVKDMLA